MAALAVTSSRLNPRDGFPSALSALSTAATGSLYKAIPRCSRVYHVPGPPRMSSTLVSSLSRGSRPSFGRYSVELHYPL
ncbi:hypothetical protein DPMN_015772 [Dreissena polymorpha]|uniref:Uncharacterized protein n=1 Tax=Dreissena polymorpha TaxID=45954 RepID=A0A9D4N8E7_DREPO|nr:hypothetical protein DPMN_015772 [Dreissena polymorpha]